MYRIEVLDITGNLVKTNWQEFSAEDIEEFRAIVKKAPGYETFTLTDKDVHKEWHYNTKNIVSINIVESYNSRD